MYAVGDVASGVLYDGYSFRDQAISELTAFGSAVRPLMVTVILTHALLVTAFGVGIWRSADHRSLRLVGVFMVGAGLIGFPVTTAIVVVAAIDGFEEWLLVEENLKPSTVAGLPGSPAVGRLKRSAATRGTLPTDQHQHLIVAPC